MPALSWTLLNLACYTLPMHTLNPTPASCKYKCCAPAAPRHTVAMLPCRSGKHQSHNPSPTNHNLLSRCCCCLLCLDLESLQLLCAEAQGGAHGGAHVHGLPVCALGTWGLVGVNRFLQGHSTAQDRGANFLNMGHTSWAATNDTVLGTIPECVIGWPPACPAARARPAYTAHNLTSPAHPHRLSWCALAPLV
jgi:hypothetical protein